MGQVKQECDLIIIPIPVINTNLDSEHTELTFATFTQFRFSLILSSLLLNVHYPAYTSEVALWSVSKSVIP